MYKLLETQINFLDYLKDASPREVFYRVIVRYGKFVSADVAILFTAFDPRDGTVISHIEYYEYIDSQSINLSEYDNAYDALRDAAEASRKKAKEYARKLIKDYGFVPREGMCTTENPVKLILEG